MPFIETRVGTIYYAEHRVPDSIYPPMLLVHGAGGSRLDWPGTLRRLPDVHTITLDLPGHGKSEKPGRKTIMDYAMVISAFLDALSMPQTIIMGHSMGGGIAQMMGLEYPEQVAGLILIGTGAKLRVHHDILERIHIAQDEVANLLSDWFWSGDTDPKLRDTTRGQIMQTSSKVLYHDYYACNNFDVMDHVNEIGTPTLVISGSQDQMTPPKYGKFLQEQIPNAQFALIEGGGHMMAIEHPQRVADTVQQWITEAFHAET